MRPGVELPAKEQEQARRGCEPRGLLEGRPGVFLRCGQAAVVFGSASRIGADEATRSELRWAIVRLEGPQDAEPWLPFAARMGAVFVHGAALTIHKAQGSQWPTVQVFAPDLRAAAWSGREDAGLPLWKRLAYVALTRAEERVRWVVLPRLARPAAALGVDDLSAG